MYAIVEIAGQQFKVEKGQKLFVQRLHSAENAEEDVKPESQVEFDKVLLVDNNGSVTVGTPTVSGAKVTAKVLSNVKGDKVLVFHKKRRKGLRKLNGHRQYFTQIEINDVIA